MNSDGILQSCIDVVDFLFEALIFHGDSSLARVFGRHFCFCFLRLQLFVAIFCIKESFNCFSIRLCSRAPLPQILPVGIGSSLDEFDGNGILQGRLGRVTLTSVSAIRILTKFGLK